MTATAQVSAVRVTDLRRVYGPITAVEITSDVGDVLLRGQAPDPTPLLYAVVVTVCALPLAYLAFKRTEATMADVI